jgi:hypothetical protein
MRPRARDVRGVLRLTLRWVITQSLVLLTWVLFRAGSFAGAWDYLRRMLAWEPSELTGRFVTIVLSFGVVLLGLDGVEYVTQDQAFLLRMRRPIAVGVSAAVVVAVCLYMLTTKPMPFVYFQF